MARSNLSVILILGVIGAAVIYNGVQLDKLKNVPQVSVKKAQELTLNIKATGEAVTVSPGEVDVITRTMQMENREGTLSGNTFIVNGRAYMGIFSAITVFDVKAIWKDIAILYYSTSVRDIEIAINSPGGGAFDGLAIADYIEKAHRMGFTVTAVASGIVASAAVPVFAVAQKRIATKSTIFMVHEAAIWKWPGRESQSDINSQTRLLNLLQARYLTKLSLHSKLSVKAWKRLEKETTWFSAERAMEYGLVDRIEGE